jgi:hypothetical protein
LTKSPEYFIQGRRCTEKIISRICVVSEVEDSEFLGQFSEGYETCKLPAKKVVPYSYTPTQISMPVSKGVVLPNWYSYYFSDKQAAVEDRLELPRLFIDGIQYTNRLLPFEDNAEHLTSKFIGDFHCILESEEERYWEYEWHG